MMDYIKITDFFQKLDFEIQSEKLTLQDSSSDVQLKVDNETIHADVRKEVRPQHVPLFKVKMERGAPFLVVSDYITPKAKKLLKGNGINYIDGFGNAFINLKQLRIFVEKGDSKPVYGAKTNKAFTKSGAQVIFQLLKNADATGLNHRELAQESNVSLGTVSNVFNGLIDARFLVKTNSAGNYQLVNKSALLEKWVTLFNEKTLPGHLIGFFKSSGVDGGYYKSINLNGRALWSGEPAAAELTGYLNPEEWSLFTTKSKVDIIKDYHLVPNEAGNIKIYEPFWGLHGSKDLRPFKPIENSKAGTVHPLIIYAELVYSGNSRNLETAQKIYDEYIRPNL